jgi:hypothetical protein
MYFIYIFDKYERRSHRVCICFIPFSIAEVLTLEDMVQATVH